MPATTPPRLFGFPLHVGSGFWLFMGLIAFINASAIGLTAAVVLAALIAAFTLVHELGHAFAARATGARAEISLAFMMGYASFIPTRQLSRWEHIGISFAGPGVQIVLGGALYLLVGGPIWPIEDLSITQFSVLWAGPLIGAFNLVPVLPFDGGNILEQLVGAVFPRHSRSIMLWFSAGVSVAGLVVVLSTPRLQGFAIFIMLPLLTVAQMAFGSRAARTRDELRQRLARGEALAWATGDVSAFPPGHVPSPWFRAHQQLQHGNAAVARDVLLADFAADATTNWWPPDAAPVADLRRLVDLLPRPLPHGPTFSDFVLSGVLLRLGDYEEAAHYAAAAYLPTRPPMMAVHVARAAAALGDTPTAMAWLRTAAATAPPDSLHHAVATAPEFGLLRRDPEFEQALSS